MVKFKGKDGCMWCLMSCCFPWVANSIFRTSARERYGIEVSCHASVPCHTLMSRVTQGDEMADWGLGVCCEALVICQTAAEHEERNNPRQ